MCSVIYQHHRWLHSTTFNHESSNWADIGSTSANIASTLPLLLASIYVYLPVYLVLAGATLEAT